jgi:hypothetical protein
MPSPESAKDRYSPAEYAGLQKHRIEGVEILRVITIDEN